VSAKVVPLRPQKRLNVNINRQTADALAEYCAANGVTITEAVRRLVVVGAHVLVAQGNGEKVQIGSDKVVFEV